LAERSRILGQVRLAIVYAFIVFLIVVSEPTMPLFVAGALTVLLGEAVRIWAAGHLVKSVKLIISGPYAHSQCPLYLGRLLILTGFGIAARSEGYLNLIALAIGYAVFFIYYLPRKLRVEGDRLAEFHGQAYENYRRRVPALFPSLRRYPGGDGRWSFRLMVHNQEPLVLTGLMVTLALLYWKTTHS
jgi:protein-S-isoprenylcysteine O-methyltransferase Ste14